MDVGTKGKLITALTEFVQQKAGTMDGIICTVKEVNTTTNLCYCVPIGDYADIQNVRLNAKGSSRGFIVVPKVDSVVTVSFLEDESAYIAQVSTIDKISIYIDGSNYLDIDSNGFIFNGGLLDGMVKVNSLVTKLNNVENKLNSLLTVLGTTWVPVANDGGAALKALCIPPLTTNLTATVKADLENTKIKQ